ncbi:hypothetical protein PVK06_048200 [Gossypium arboreum]|uniref:Uncharacterized protein n=1 Tax=Gossypium arboreum TaxID=29729 RepID=A0ABR0MFA6_GOSAR|nr:hypothetical protein PVK06_048200 [Gossypium arboreum]
MFATMESIKECSSITRLLLLLGSENYAYWKPHMRAIIMSINEAAWKAIEEGWTQPIVIDVDGTTPPKGRSKYTAKERKTAYGNSQVLNVIFNRVDVDQLKK